MSLDFSGVDTRPNEFDHELQPHMYPLTVLAYRDDDETGERPVWSVTYEGPGTAVIPLRMLSRREGCIVWLRTTYGDGSRHDSKLRVL